MANPVIKSGHQKDMIGLNFVLEILTILGSIVSKMCVDKSGRITKEILQTLPSQCMNERFHGLGRIEHVPMVGKVVEISMLLTQKSSYGHLEPKSKRQLKAHTL